MSRFRPAKLRKQLRKAAKSLGIREAEAAEEIRRRQTKVAQRRRYRARRKQREAEL